MRASFLAKTTAGRRFLSLVDAQYLDMESDAPASARGTRSRRMQVRFDSELYGRIRVRADKSDQTLSATVRQLVTSALTSDSEPGPRSDSQAALAALVAAEHAVLMVAAVLPEGQRRMHELAREAAAAAERRLSLLRESDS